MSSSLRLASRLSTTMCVNLGSSSPATRPPLEVIRFATFSSLRIFLHQLTTPERGDAYSSVMVSSFFKFGLIGIPFARALKGEST